MLVQAGASIFGHLASQGDRDKAAALVQQATDAYGNIDIPTLEALSDTALKDVQTNPQYTQAMDSALARMQSEVDAGGETLEDKAAYNRATNDAQRRTSGRMGAIRQNMAAKGTGGSGAELAMLMSEEQGQADRANQAGMDMAQDARRRYLDAVQATGRMGSAYRAQDYGEQSEAARATDLIHRYNAGLPQQNFQNQMTKAGAMANAANGGAKAAQGQAQATAGMWGGVGQAAGQVGTAYAQRPAGQTAAPVKPYNPYDDDVEPPERY